MQIRLRNGVFNKQYTKYMNKSTSFFKRFLKVFSMEEHSPYTEVELPQQQSTICNVYGRNSFLQRKFA
jgi:hypothetical protein